MKWKLAACRINKGLKQKDVAELMHANLFGSFLRQENRFTTSKSRSLIVSMADGGFVKNTAPLPKYGSR